MKLLLDTPAVLWWQMDDRRLSSPARRAIATADIVWVSAASGWEVAIKAALGRLRAEEQFAVTVAADDFTELPVTLARRHASRVSVSVERAAPDDDSATVVVREHEPGYVVLHDSGRFNRTTVRARIRARDGALLRADVTVYAPGPGTAPHRIRVAFRADATLGMLVPDRLEERYVADGEGRGTAVYRRYRRFQTSGRVVPPER